MFVVWSGFERHHEGSVSRLFWTSAWGLVCLSRALASNCAPLSTLNDVISQSPTDAKLSEGLYSQALTYPKRAAITAALPLQTKRETQQPWSRAAP